MDNYTWKIERYQRTNRHLILFTIGIVILGLIISLSALYISTNTEKEIQSLNEPKNDLKIEIADVFSIVDEWNKKELTQTTAYDFMLLIGIEHPHIALAQMRIESGNFKSKLSRENNNYFGMKHPTRRATTSLGNKNGFAHYQSWVHSIIDYALWQKTFATQLTENEYLDSLAYYAEDKNYIAKVEKLAKSLENRK